MKIITYNIHSGGKKGTGNQWQRILDNFFPELVLAQESGDPLSYEGVDRYPVASAIWHPIGRTWGSAVLSSSHVMTEIAVTAPEFKGWITGGRIEEPVVGGGCRRPLVVFSVHTPSPGPYDKNVYKILDYLKEVTVGCDLIVGGDFNVTTAVRHQSETLKNTQAERRLIDRLRTEFGLINAWQVLHPNQDLPQTLRWTGNRTAPYHCDGLFIPLAWAQHLKSCEVLEGDEWSALSDHNPIVAHFADNRTPRSGVN
jgi:hypothetical protein